MKKILRTENLWNNKKMRLILAAVAVIAVILGCLTVPSGEVSEAAGKKLKVSCKKTVAVNCTTTIKTNVKAKFQSSDKKTATVNSKGIVKGKKAGKVKITVTSKTNKKDQKTVTITVKNQLVITAPAGSKAELYVGETMKIKANLPSAFKSSDTSVATVSSSGKVAGKKAGTAKITVTSKSNKKWKKTVTITVKEKPEEKTETTTENKTTESKTTEATTENITTENNTAENNTTEKNTTEDKTTENTTTEEQPKPENKTLVGIEANYGTNKIPYVLTANADYVFYSAGIDLTLLYNDGSKEKLPIHQRCNIQETRIREEDVDYGKVITYEVEYKGFTDEMIVEYIKTDEKYPLNIFVEETGYKKEPGTELSPEDYTVLVTYSDGSGEYVDNSKCNYAYMGETETHEYEYMIGYDYYFTDSKGNELYVFQFYYLYLPHK